MESANATYNDKWDTHKTEQLPTLLVVLSCDLDLSS